MTPPLALLNGQHRLLPLHGDSQIAIEAAGFERDVLAALRPLSQLSLGMVPLGSIQSTAFECTWNGSQVGPVSNGTLFAQVITVLHINA